MRPAHIDQVMSGKGFVSARTAARAVGVHLSTIYRAISAGHIEGEQCGRHWYAKADSVVAYYRFPGLAEDLAAALHQTSKSDAPTPEQHMD